MAGPLTMRDLRAIPIGALGSVGPKIEPRLTAMGIDTVAALLAHYPRRYLDRTKQERIARLVPGEEATVFARVERISTRRGGRGRAIVTADVTDGTSVLALTFFNQGWRERQLPVGTEAAFFGKVEEFRGRPQMTNPVVDIVGQLGEKTGVIVPIYPQSGKADVSTWQIAKIVRASLERTRARGIAEPLPAAMRAELGLVDRNTALWGIHRPEKHEDWRNAVKRLKFDEFLRMQIRLVARQRAMRMGTRGIRHDVEGPLAPLFREQLPFPLTGDQRRTIAEIERDLASPAPMHRLLQGDVGSGKTVVALSALLTGVQGGYQGALMAPTEVLAEQHYLASIRMLDGLTIRDPGTLTGERPVRVALLTNRVGAAQRRRIAAELGEGELDLLVGTHALLYGDTQFAALGVIVIDEQHRFGVAQRAQLLAKGRDDAQPDVLVMTATPIPRTAAMLIYGDLDKSELREMPPGRTPITTEVLGSDSDGTRAYERMRAEVASGRQGYVVCPLVEGSPRVEAKAAHEEYERLGFEDLAGLRLGLLHGQLPARDKEAVMAQFRAGEIDVLVATSVIEVGVDVPNATVMIVENADRFGLSQLHQLRGRVGRGGGASWCFLVSEAKTPDGRARMEAMAASTDGFHLAERDLEIRGAGEVFGERQSGLSDMLLGRIPRDESVVIQARAVAEEILRNDPTLSSYTQLRDEIADILHDERVAVAETAKPDAATTAVDLRAVEVDLVGDDVDFLFSS